MTSSFLDQIPRGEDRVGGMTCRCSTDHSTTTPIHPNSLRVLTKERQAGVS